MSEPGEFLGLVCGERRLDWVVFERRVLQAAAGFKALGIGEGDTVAIMMRNDIAFLEASMAATRRGAYAVPINWHFKVPEVAYILADCKARVLVIHADLWRQVKEAVPGHVAVLQVTTPPEICTAYGVATEDARPTARAVVWSEWAGGQTPTEEPPSPPRESMIYTSGTTGHPKGVKRFRPTPEEAIEVERLRVLVYGISPGMRAIVPGPLYHSAPNSFGLRSARMGGRVVLMPRFDAEDFLRAVERHRITHALMVPTMFVRLLNLPAATRQRYDLSSLRFVVHAAAPCPPDVKAAMIEWWGPIIVEFYGGTESGPVTFCDSLDWLAHRGTVGRVVDDAVVTVMDDDGRELPAGEAGELFMRIKHYPDFTYQNQPEERMRIDRDGLITLGDVGYFDRDGYLYLCDRKQDMIISGGVNIYPAEIEAAIHAIPGVRDCAVFGIPDTEFGEAIMAVVEPANGARITPAFVMAEVRRQLADYKVPRTVEIRTTLPREDSGKIRKRLLREPYWAGAGRRI